MQAAGAARMEVEARLSKVAVFNAASLSIVSCADDKMGSQ